jgi:hypothetical protein
MIPQHEELVDAVYKAADDAEAARKSLDAKRALLDSAVAEAKRGGASTSAIQVAAGYATRKSVYDAVRRSESAYV